MTTGYPTGLSGDPHPSPAGAPTEVRGDAAQVIPLPAHRARSAGPIILAVLGILVGALALLIAIAYMLVTLGGAAPIAAIFALIPLGIVLLGIRWVDRWEPEPRAALAFAFLWGAGVSVLLALTVDAEVQNVLASAGLDGASAGVQFLGAVVQAPIVEESAKGLGVLLIYLVARKNFDGPVDGIVYAATVAAGFAFTENIQYFGRALIESGSISSGVLMVFFLRAVLSPFAHVMFTAMTGIAIGFAARRGSALAGIGLFFVGLIPAMFLHGLWNSAGFFFTDISFFGYYAVVQVPLFVGLIFLVRYLRTQETRLTTLRLGEYAAAGWFNAGEIGNLATPTGRGQARAWAREKGVLPVMTSYIRDATRLATTRQRIVSNRGREAAQVEEARLLASIGEYRRSLLARPQV